MRCFAHNTFNEGYMSNESSWKISYKQKVILFYNKTYKLMSSNTVTLSQTH